MNLVMIRHCAQGEHNPVLDQTSHILLNLHLFQENDKIVLDTIVLKSRTIHVSLPMQLHPHGIASCCSRTRQEKMYVGQAA